MLYQGWNIVDGDSSFHFSVKRLRKQGLPGDILLYQKDNLDQALALVKNWDSAIDGGANYGLMSYHMSPLFKQILAFEIDDEIRQCFEINMRQFDRHNVQIESCGLGEESKSVDLVRTKKRFGNFINPSVDQGNFPVRSIDSYDLLALDFIKLDCEGYEPLIIRGAKHTIKKFFPVILMERKVLSKKYAFGVYDTQELLRTWGYDRVIDLGKDVILARS